MKLYFTNSALVLKNVYFSVMDSYKWEGMCLFFLLPHLRTVFILFLWDKILQMFGYLVDPLRSSGWLDYIRLFLCFFLRFWGWLFQPDILSPTSVLGLFAFCSRVISFLRIVLWGSWTWRYSSWVDQWVLSVESSLDVSGADIAYPFCSVTGPASFPAVARSLRKTVSCFPSG